MPSIKDAHALRNDDSYRNESWICRGRGPRFNSAGPQHWLCRGCSRVNIRRRSVVLDRVISDRPAEDKDTVVRENQGTRSNNTRKSQGRRPAMIDLRREFVESLINPSSIASSRPDYHRVSSFVVARRNLGEKKKRPQPRAKKDIIDASSMHKGAEC